MFMFFNVCTLKTFANKAVLVARCGVAIIAFSVERHCQLEKKLYLCRRTKTRNDEKDNDQFLPPCDSCDHHDFRYVYPDGGSTN